MRTNIKITCHFLLGSILMLLFLEVFLKTAEIKLPYKTFDKSIGKTYLPNALINEKKENFYINKTNQFGFIGNQTLTKKPNTIRIAFFGDSFVEAIQLDPKYNFCSVLEQKLNANKMQNKKYEVLNFGLSNSVLPDVYIRKKLLAEKFDIDYYIYFLDSYDLILDSQSVINSIQIDQNLNIVPNQSSSFKLYSKIQPFFDNSSCLNMFLEAYILNKRGETKKIILDKLYQPKKTSSDFSYYDYFFKNFPELNKKILNELLDTKSVLIINEKPTKELKKTLQKNQIQYFSTQSALDNVRKKGTNPYYWKNSNIEGHFNYEAHQAIGQFLYDIVHNKIKETAN